MTQIISKFQPTNTLFAFVFFFNAIRGAVPLAASKLLVHMWSASNAEEKSLQRHADVF